jgi:hypothetical protein
MRELNSREKIAATSAVVVTALAGVVLGHEFTKGNEKLDPTKAGLETVLKPAAAELGRTILTRGGRATENYDHGLFKVVLRTTIVDSNFCVDTDHWLLSATMQKKKNGTFDPSTVEDAEVRLADQDVGISMFDVQDAEASIYSPEAINDENPANAWSAYGTSYQRRRQPYGLEIITTDLGGHRASAKTPAEAIKNARTIARLSQELAHTALSPTKCP